MSSDRPPWAAEVADLVPPEAWAPDGDAWRADFSGTRMWATTGDADAHRGATDVTSATGPRAALLALDVATDPDHPAHELDRLRRLWAAVTGEPAPRLIVCVGGYWMRAARACLIPSLLYGGWGLVGDKEPSAYHMRIRWPRSRPTIAEQMAALGLPGVPDAD